MDIRKILKYATSSAIPGPVKLLGLAAMHASRRRVAGVFLDPVMGCNLSCRMCYFSDPERRKELHGVITPERLDEVARAFYGRALKLQIGCGAEPTLYPHLSDIVRQARQYGVPHIALVTNGQLIASGRVSLSELADAGLSELIISLHGTRPDTYEHLMQGAKWRLFQQLTQQIADVRTMHPGLSLRVNFTVNSLNVDDLAGDRFWSIWPDGAVPDTIQLRPVQNLGASSWQDFDLAPLKEKYDGTIGSVIEECRRRGICCIAPTLDNIDAVDTTQDATSAIIEDFTYCYVSPSSCYKDDFRLGEDTFESYHRRRHTLRHLLGAIFSPKARDRRATKKLNYKVE